MWRWWCGYICIPVRGCTLLHRCFLKGNGRECVFDCGEHEIAISQQILRWDRGMDQRDGHRVIGDCSRSKSASWSEGLSVGYGGW